DVLDDLLGDGAAADDHGGRRGEPALLLFDQRQEPRLAGLVVVHPVLTLTLHTRTSGRSGRALVRSEGVLPDPTWTDRIRFPKVSGAGPGLPSDDGTPSLPLLAVGRDATGLRAGCARPHGAAHRRPAVPR